MRKKTKYKFTHLLLIYSILAIYTLTLSVFLTACGNKNNPAEVKENISENAEETTETEDFEELAEDVQKNIDMTLDEALKYEMLNDAANYHIYENFQLHADNEEDEEWAAPFYYYTDAAVDKENGKMWIERIGGTDGFECYYEYDLKNDKKDCIKYSEDFEPIYKSTSEVPASDEYMLQNCFTEDVQSFFEDFADKYDAKFSISDVLEPVFFNSFEGYVDDGLCYVVTIKCDTDILEKSMALPEKSLENSTIKAYISRDTSNFELRINSELPVFTDEEAAVFKASYFCDDELLKKETQFSYTFAITDIDRVDLEYYEKDSGSYFLGQIVHEEEVEND